MQGQISEEQPTEEEIIRDFPELDKDDIHACLLFAADREKKLSAPLACSWFFDQNLSFELPPSLNSRPPFYPKLSNVNSFVEMFVLV